MKVVVENRPIPLIKNDGTQFIWAGNLARLYLEVLNSQVNRKTYFGLSRNFVSWDPAAREAIKRSNSKSEIQLEDKGWSDEGLSWDGSDMKRDFGLEFDAWEKIGEHLDYYIDLERLR